MNPYLTAYPRYLWQLLNGFRASHEAALAQIRDQDLIQYTGEDRRLRILDVANGRLRPQYAILRAHGHQVYGIDLVNRPRSSGSDIAYRAARRLYTWRLGLPRIAVGQDRLVCGDVGVLPFPSDRFDLATSIAAFEHFLDVPRVVAEIHRVLRPGGLVWVCIHLFSSLSGGHNVSFTEIPLRHMPDGIDAWDHLRSRRLPFHVPLNEWRKDQYIETFAKHFQILNHYCAIREGEELLTPELAAELATYSRDELTSLAYVILARKIS
jgi:SAM-dependent methyltransferase